MQNKSISRQVLLFWAPLALLGTSLYWQLLARYAGLPPRVKQGSNDISIYHHAGEALLRGEVPYRDFFIEYPPGSLISFLPPALLSSDKVAYTGLFASEMALVAVAALVLTALTARKLWGPWAWIIPALTFTAAAIMLFHMILARYDIVVALTLSLAAFCASRGAGYLFFAYASLGFGAAAKLVPALATLPLAFVRRQVAARGYTVFCCVLVLLFAPALLLGGDGFLKSFSYHAERDLQVESLAASVLMKLGWVSGTRFDFGGLEVRGRGVELASSLSFLLTGALLLITAAVMYREYRRGRLGAEQYPRYAAALILAYMLGSKVLSPQYMLWLLPLVPLVGRRLVRIGISAVFLAACGATRLVLEYYRDLLYLRFPGPDLVLVRNLLLVLLWGLLLFLVDKTSEQEAP